MNLKNLICLAVFFLMASVAASPSEKQPVDATPDKAKAKIRVEVKAGRAARHGDLDALKKLTSQHKFLLESEQIVYELFGDALYRDHYAVADFLLPHIKNYDYVTESGTTYIMTAGGKGKQAKYLKLFLEKSTLIDHRAEDGDTAFSSAAAVYDLDAMKMLIQHGAKDLDSHSYSTPVPLNVAVAHGDAELVEMMLKRGADPNHQYEAFYRQFPLQIAAEKGFAEIAELLLKYKADPNKLTCYGETPLFLAKRRAEREHWRDEDKIRDEKVVAILKQYGAKLPKNKPRSRESFGSFRRVGC